MLVSISFVVVVFVCALLAKAYYACWQNNQVLTSANYELGHSLADAQMCIKAQAVVMTGLKEQTEFCRTNHCSAPTQKPKSFWRQLVENIGYSAAPAIITTGIIRVATLL
jgi:hypothetical protein